MGIFRQEVHILNAKDVYSAEDGKMSENEIRQMKVEMMVDTSA